MARGDIKNVHTTNVREKAIDGAGKVYDAVAAAYGPTSGNVALEKSYGNVVISHDGVSIAKEVILGDKLEDVGADLLIQASSKSNDVSGDGTTGSILLGYHIMRLANQRIAAGFNPMGLRRGIDLAATHLKQQLDAMATPVPDNKLTEVATISASDPEIGALVADTVLKTGDVGITIEEYDGLGVIQDVIEGLYFEKGWTKPHFVTDREALEAIHDNAHILVVEKRISTNQDIIPLLEMVYSQTDHKTVLIIGNISNRALETCALTNLKGQTKVCVVPPPVYGDQVLPFLEDVACMTGGRVVPASLPSDKVTVDYLGFAKKVIVGQSYTSIIEGNAIEEDVQGRINTLESQLKDDKFSAFQKERMEKRLSKLRGKIGIIKVGGATESGRKEMKFRVEDAVHATRAARAEGIVPGGGTALARLTKRDGTDPDKDVEAGVDVVIEALPELFKQLMANAGEDPGYRLQQVRKAKSGYGFNVKSMTEEPIRLFDSGIIDPVKVVKSIVENACEVAGIAITLNGAVTIDRDEQLKQLQYNRMMQ